MARSVSADLKARIPVLHHKGYTIQQICDLLGIQKTLVYKTLKLHSRFGIISDPFTFSRAIRRRRILTFADMSFIRAVVKTRRTIYLDELQHELWIKRHRFASIPTLHRALRSLQFTRKIVSASAAEQNEGLRAMYMNRIGAEARDANMLVFIDEAAKDRRTSARQYGRVSKGECCRIDKYFIRGIRYSILPALTLDGIIAYDIVEGSVDAERFLSFLKEHVVCTISFAL
jgi:hypothetical protein